MHRFIADEGTHFTYNGDFSGEVLISVEIGVEGEGGETRQITIPAHDLLQFVATYVLGNRIGRLEGKTWQELLT